MSHLSPAWVGLGRASLAVMIMTAGVRAQTAPCGRTVLRTGGESTEDRFLTDSLEHVKASVVRALPAVSARLTKDEGAHIEAKIDRDLLLAQKNKAFGSEGMKVRSTGTFKIDLAQGNSGRCGWHPPHHPVFKGHARPPGKWEICDTSGRGGSLPDDRAEPDRPHR